MIRYFITQDPLLAHAGRRSDTYDDHINAQNYPDSAKQASNKKSDSWDRTECSLRSDIESALRKGVDMICLRCNNREENDLTHMLAAFGKLCSENKVMPLINLAYGNEEALRAKGDMGIHIKGKDLELIPHFTGLARMIVYSAHNISEIERALSLGADFVTISPIFYDKFNKALGVQFLKELSSDIKRRSIALGGIIDGDKVSQVRQTGVVGFASIRYFLEK